MEFPVPSSSICVGERSLELYIPGFSVAILGDCHTAPGTQVLPAVTAALTIVHSSWTVHTHTFSSVFPVRDPCLFTVDQFFSRFLFCFGFAHALGCWSNPASLKGLTPPTGMQIKIKKTTKSWPFGVGFSRLVALEHLCEKLCSDSQHRRFTPAKKSAGETGIFRNWEKMEKEWNGGGMLSKLREHEKKTCLHRIIQAGF